MPTLDYIKDEVSPSTHGARLASARMPMSLRYWSVQAAALAVLCASLALSAGIRVAGAPLPPTLNRTAVRGVVWNGDNSPIPGARVRLRNLQTGRVEANAV